jgi:hypothetical protein
LKYSRNIKMVKPRAMGIRGHIERKRKKNTYRAEMVMSEERRALDNIVAHFKQILSCRIKDRPNTTPLSVSYFSIHVYDFQVVSSVQIFLPNFNIRIILFSSMLRISVISYLSL